MWALWLIPAAIVIFLAVIIIRAAGFTPKAQPVIDEEKIEFNDVTVLLLRIR